MWPNSTALHYAYYCAKKKLHRYHLYALLEVIPSLINESDALFKTTLYQEVGEVKFSFGNYT